MRFNKPYLPFHDQLDLLAQRGLTITDKPEAVRFLNYVNYYRLSGYMLPFESSRHVFQRGTTFEQIRELYLFDRDLRGLVMESTAAVEVFVKTQFAAFFGNLSGPFAHLNLQCYASPREFQDWHEHIVAEIKRSQETFVRHFKNKYDEWPDLPIWVTTDLLSFGSISMLYKILQPKLKRQLAQCFQVKEPVLQSWLHVLSYTRNLCAHHSRLWNRTYSIKAVIPRRNISWDIFLTSASHDKPFLALTIIGQLLATIRNMTGYDIQWHRRIIDLLDSPPNVPNFEQAMGIPPNWKQSSLWQ